MLVLNPEIKSWRSHMKNSTCDSKSRRSQLRDAQHKRSSENPYCSGGSGAYYVRDGEAPEKGRGAASNEAIKSPRRP
eukprot:130966-Pleurochrysis_carterae.AAC.1